MDKFYHFTSNKYFYDIMKNGLIPRNGIRTQSIGDDRSGVFLSKGMDNLIIMFGQMLSYYDKYSGIKGLEEYYQIVNYIEYLKTQKMHYSTICEIEKNNNYLNRIAQIRSCIDFFEYIEGSGCILSIDTLDGISDIQPEDCCYSGIISPEKIKVVNIRNKYNGYYECSREAVLAYFILSCSFEKILEKISNIEDKRIENSLLYLYTYVYNSEYSCYNPNNWTLEEIPINCYDIEKKKTLI